MPKRPVIHRSFTIDRALVKQAQEVIPVEVADNLNRLVTVALAELVAKYERAAFDGRMAEMAADPAVRQEARKAAQDLAHADMDGL